VFLIKDLKKDEIVINLHKVFVKKAKDVMDYREYY